MKTVPDIIHAVYGSEKAAAEAKLAKPSTIATWKNRGHFSTRALPKILTDAMAKGIILAIGDIPLKKQAA